MDFKGIKDKALSNKGSWWVFIIWSLLVSGYWLPRNFSFYGLNDWDLTYSMFEAARKSIVDYGVFPQFNIWSGFGTDMIADPQNGFFSIFFIPILLFGTFYGYKIGILLAMVLGAAGAYRWFGCFNKDKVLNICAALMFASAGYFSAHIFTACHSNVLYLYLLPWFLFGIKKLASHYHWKYLLLCTAVLFQIICGGAPIVFLIALVAAAWIWISDVFILKNHNTIYLLPGIIVCSLLFASWKLIPGLALWSTTPRLVLDESGISPIGWLQSLGGYQARTAPWHAWFEYTLGFDIVLLGLLWYYKSALLGKWWQWLMLIAPVLWLCLGNFPAEVNPWYLLNHYAPFFNSMRAPMRFGFVFLPFLYAAILFAIRDVQELRLLRVLFVFGAISRMLAFSAETSLIANSTLLLPGQIQAADNTVYPRPIWLRGEDRNYQFLHVMQNELVLNSYEPLATTPVYDSLRTMTKGGTLMYFSPTRLRAKTQGKGPVVFNVRKSDNWHLRGKGRLVYYSGLLAVENPGPEVEVNYRNPLVNRGFICSALGLPFLALLHFFSKKRSNRIQV